MKCPYCKKLNMSTQLDSGANEDRFAQKYFCNNCHKYFSKVYQLTFLFDTDEYGNKL